MATSTKRAPSIAWWVFIWPAGFWLYLLVWENVFNVGFLFRSLLSLSVFVCLISFGVHTLVIAFLKRVPNRWPPLALALVLGLAGIFAFSTDAILKVRWFFVRSSYEAKVKAHAASGSEPIKFDDGSDLGTYHLLMFDRKGDTASKYEWISKSEDSWRDNPWVSKVVRLGDGWYRVEMAQ